MGEILKNYYIGDPEAPNKRGQNKHGYVYCLSWLMIRPKKAGVYPVASGGCSIGDAKTLAEAKKKVYDYAIQEMQRKLDNAANKVNRLSVALKVLREGGVKALAKYEGPYKQ